MMTWWIEALMTLRFESLDLDGLGDFEDDFEFKCLDVRSLSLYALDTLRRTKRTLSMKDFESLRLRSIRS